MENYIGMDAHSKTCTFVVLNNKGQETAAQRTRTCESEILKFLRVLKGKKSLVFEESHLSKWLYSLLCSEVEELVVCNPSFITRRSGAKNDYLDTCHLAQQLRGGFLTPVFHQDNFFSELRNVVSAYEDLVADMVRLKNQYKALFRMEAHDTVGTTIYGDPTRIDVLGKETDRFVASSIFTRIQALEEIKEQYLSRFKENTKKHPEIRALTSIPGIRYVRANLIAAIVCSPHRFETKYKFWSYCMLVRHELESDGQSYGRTTTHANKALKTVFLGAAEDVLRGDSALRKYYNQLRSAGVDHKAAKKNVARKIAAISLAVMKRGEPYHDTFTPKTNVV